MENQNDSMYLIGVVAFGTLFPVPAEAAGKTAVYDSGEIVDLAGNSEMKAYGERLVTGGRLLYPEIMGEKRERVFPIISILNPEMMKMRELGRQTVEEPRNGE